MLDPFYVKAKKILAVQGDHADSAWYKPCTQNKFVPPSTKSGSTNIKSICTLLVDAVNSKKLAVDEIMTKTLCTAPSVVPAFNLVPTKTDPKPDPDQNYIMCIFVGLALLFLYKFLTVSYMR